MKNKAKPEIETPFEKFRQFTEKVISVPKSEIDRRKKEYPKLVDWWSHGVMEPTIQGEELPLKTKNEKRGRRFLQTGYS